MEAQADHTFQEIQEESKKALLKLVCRDQAIIDRLWMEQGTRTFIEFLSKVEDQEHLCRTEEMNLTSMDMQRMILIAGGMKDHKLAENAIAEKYSLKQVILTNIHSVEEKLFQGDNHRES